MNKLPGIPKDTVYLIGMIAAGAAVLFVMSKGVRGASKAVASGAVNAVGGFVEGGVKSVGEIVGIPDTNTSACDKALAEGRTWDASFACPAGRFIKSLFGSDPAQENKPDENSSQANGFMDSTR